MMTPAAAAQLWQAAVSLQLKVLLIVLAAWLLTLALRRASSAVRHAVWTTALLGIVLLPVLALLPAQTVEVPAWAAARLRVDPVVPAAPASTVPAPTHQVAADARAASRSAEADARASQRGGVWPQFALLLWLAGALARVAWLAVQLLRVRALAAERVHARVDAQQLTDRLTGAMRLHVPVAVRYSAQVTMPCTTGLLRPLLLLPAAAADWPEQRLRVVLMHELAHIRRNDYAVWLLTEFTCALYWINPLVWAARMRVHAEQEQACDDEVLRHGVSPVDYAQQLLEVARAFYVRRRLADVTLTLARGVTLKARVRAILDGRRNRQQRATLTGACATVVLAAWALSVSVLRAAAPPQPILDPVTADTPLDASLFDDQVSHTAPPGNVTLAVAAPVQLSPLIAAAVRGYVVSHAENRRVDLQLDPRSDARYVIWARVRVGERDENSFVVTVGDHEYDWHVDGRRRDDRGVWRWERVEIDDDALHPSGVASITLRASEDGAELDAALVTTDERYRPRGADPLLPPEQPVEIWLEAEEARVTAPFVRETDRRAGNGRYLRVAGREHSRAAPPTEGTATFKVRVPRPGTYLIWARTRIDDDDADSFWVRANDGAWFAWNGIEADDDWEWSAVRTEDSAHAIAVDLHAGTNTITFAYREPGARLDRLLVTNDPRLTPRRGANAQQGNRPQP
jgi:beta-lactamase regulating signal transducer with metallopeptidase domain